MFFPSQVAIFDKLLFTGSFSVANEVSFFLSVLLMMLCSVTLMMTLTCAYFQLKTFNNFLSKLIADPRKKSNIQIIIRTSILHDSICDCCEAISRFYNLLIMIFFFEFVFFNIFFFYLVYSLFKVYTLELFYFTLTGVLWISHYAPCIFWVTMFSSWIESEGLKTGNHIQMLANVEKNLETLKKLTSLMQQVTHRSPKISCGMFDVNWKSFFGMLGAIFSFWIIMIQFYDVTN